jgi:glycopeptide antibiotics resistance protein
VKLLPKILLVLYLLILLWLVLFKFSVTFPVLSDYNTRSLNLIPFADFSRNNFRDVLYNFVGFIPFGILLGVNLKRSGFWRKIVLVLMFSLVVEIVQLVFKFGVADITDVITNTFGGFIGLVLYGIGNWLIDTEKLDRLITTTGTILLIPSVAFLSILLVHNVTYQPAPAGGMPGLERRPQESR